MRDVIQFALLGLGAGAIYALLAQGVVLVYRGSGVLNFAQGAMAMAGAYVFYELTARHHLGNAVSFVVSIVALAITGVLVYQLFMRRLQKASPLARVIATLAVTTILQAVAGLRYGASVIFLNSWLPTRSFILPDKLRMPADRLWLTVIAIAITGLLHMGSKYTKLGLATAAVAESPRGTSVIGWSPHLLGTLTWAAAGAFAAAAGVLIVPLTSLDPSIVPWIIVPAMAAALIGGFSSFPLTLLGGLAIGILQSEIGRYSTIQGAPNALPLFLIIAVLVIRGKSLPLRSYILDRLPALGSGALRFSTAVPALAITVLMLFVFPADWTAALTTSIITAIIFVSIVVLTGYTGQLSLAQYALAGGGALITGRLALSTRVPFEVDLLCGVVGAVLLGVIFGLPALRARGPNLAIVTLGLGVVAQSVFFDSSLTGSANQGLTIRPQTFFGIHLNGITDPRSYGLMSLGFLAVVVWMVCSLRQGRVGRRLIAVRTNERAAASLGINIFVSKLYAFGVAAGIAGLGGILLVFSAPVLYYASFDPITSISAVLLTVVGGVGYVIGGLLGATLVAGGFPGGIIAEHVGNNQEWLVLIGGIVVLLVMLQDPNGMASANAVAFRRIVERLRRSRNQTKESATGVEVFSPATVPDSMLAVEDLVVRLGGVTAVDHVTLRVKSGQVIGLIGPNGAGKTTIIDAITGFVRPNNGEVLLNGERIDRWSAHKRARAGVTRSFQSLELFDDLTVLDNILAASDTQDVAAYGYNLIWPRGSKITAPAAAAIRTFELERELHRRVNELSFGKRRLVAIARAAATAPSFLLLDEALAGMSESEAYEAGTLVRRMASEQNVGILFIEHDVSLVMGLCDQVVVVDFGVKIAEGSPAEIRTNQKVIQAYLGVEDTSLIAHGGDVASVQESTASPPGLTSSR